MKEYSIYPFDTMNITQNWNEGNHIPHWKNVTNWSDKPWDEALKDSGRDYFIPQNDFKVIEILGIGTNTTNTVILKSVNKLSLPIGKEDYLYLTLTHMEEDNLKQITKGQILKKGTKILKEGKDGNATGNHFHVTANLGKYYGFLKNNNGKWCFTFEKSLTPSEAFFVDSNFTKILNSKDNNFKNIPIASEELLPVERDDTKNQLYVKVDSLRYRKSPSLEGEIIGYIRKGYYNYNNATENDNYLWYGIDSYYVAYSDEWIDLLPVKSIPDDKTDNDNKEEANTDKEEKNNILSIISSFLKSLVIKVAKLFKKWYNRKYFLKEGDIYVKLSGSLSYGERSWNKK